MDLKLIRKQKTNNSTIGDLGIDGGVHICFTLEPPNPILTGRYIIEDYLSPKHDMMIVPLLIGVPEHHYIEIHIGNGPSDTKDCILVGLSRAPDWIGDSTKAFIKLMLKYIVPAWLRKELVRIEIVEEYAG